MTDNKYIQMFLPVGILIVTDPFLGLYSAMPVVYLCIVAASVISSLFKNYNYKNMIISGLISVGIWHILVNLCCMDFWYTSITFKRGIYSSYSF